MAWKCRESRAVICLWYVPLTRAAAKYPLKELLYFELFVCIQFSFQTVHDIGLKPMKPPCCKECLGIAHAPVSDGEEMLHWKKLCVNSLTTMNANHYMLKRVSKFSGKFFREKTNDKLPSGRCRSYKAQDHGLFGGQTSKLEKRNKQFDQGPVHVCPACVKKINITKATVVFISTPTKIEHQVYT